MELVLRVKKNNGDRVDENFNSWSDLIDYAIASKEEDGEEEEEEIEELEKE